MQARTGIAVGVCVAAVVATLGWRLGRAPAPRPPNVVLVLWDTVRADRLSLYGHDRPTSPWLEEFAASARVYERAIAPGMWTVPTHGSLFTGKAVSSHGANARWIWLDHGHETLAEALAGAGYETWAWSSNPYLSPSTNLLQGFETVELAWEGTWATRAAEATRDKLIAEDRSVEISPAWEPEAHGEGWPRHLTAYKDAGPVITEAFSAWLDARPADRPFFAYLNYLEAHHPRVPSMAAREQVLEPDEIAAGLSTPASLFRTMSAMEGRVAFSDAELAALRGVYDASVADLDRATAGLVAALEARGLLDDTVVIITSDHGENLGEHGMFDHRWSVHDTLLHVPLIIRYPAAVPPGREGRTVSTRDLFDTVRHLAGLTRSPGVLSPDDDAYAELVQPTPRLPVVREAWDDLDPARWRRRYRVAVEGADKLVLDSTGAHALYHLDRDPGELEDRAADEPARVRELRATLDESHAAATPYDPSTRGPSDKPQRALEPSDGAREQLKLLGYAE